MSPPPCYGDEQCSSVVLKRSAQSLSRLPYSAYCFTSRKAVRRFNLTLFPDQIVLEAIQRSRRLESDPDAVDDDNFFCALLCSKYSITRCCIAVWTVESNQDFLRPICRNSHTCFSLEFPSPRWIANQAQELHLPFFRFCLETYRLIGGVSANTIELPLHI